MLFDDYSSHFHRSLSIQAHQQFLQLQDTTGSFYLTDTEDAWTYTWNRSNYSSMHMYKHLMHGQQAHYLFKWLWKGASRLPALA